MSEYKTKKPFGIEDVYTATYDNRVFLVYKHKNYKEITHAVQALNDLKKSMFKWPDATYQHHFRIVHNN